MKPLKSFRPIHGNFILETSKMVANVFMKSKYKNFPCSKNLSIVIFELGQVRNSWMFGGLATNFFNCFLLLLGKGGQINNGVVFHSRTKSGPANGVMKHHSPTKQQKICQTGKTLRD